MIGTGILICHEASQSPRRKRDRHFGRRWGHRKTAHPCAADVEGTRPVLDDEWLAEPLRQLLTHQAREDVSWAASGKGDDHAHRARRIGLRPGDPRDRRQRGSGRSQMEKLSAGKFHSLPL